MFKYIIRTSHRLKYRNTCLKGKLREQSNLGNKIEIDKNYYRDQAVFQGDRLKTTWSRKQTHLIKLFHWPLLVIKMFQFSSRWKQQKTVALGSGKERAVWSSRLDLAAEKTSYKLRIAWSATKCIVVNENDNEHILSWIARHRAHSLRSGCFLFFWGGGEEQVEIEQRSNWPPYGTHERKENWGDLAKKQPLRKLQNTQNRWQFLGLRGRHVFLTRAQPWLCGWSLSCRCLRMTNNYMLGWGETGSWLPFLDFIPRPKIREKRTLMNPWQRTFGFLPNVEVPLVIQDWRAGY